MKVASAFVAPEAEEQRHIIWHALDASNLQSRIDLYDVFCHEARKRAFIDRSSVQRKEYTGQVVIVLKMTDMIIFKHTIPS